MDISSVDKASYLIGNDAIVCGLLLAVLALVFYTNELPNWQGFYRWCPKLLLCYFIPALLNTFGVFSAENSRLYFIASRYFLPACLVLLTLSADLRGILALGPRAISVFLSGTLGIVLGGPAALIALSYLSPSFIEEQGWMAIAGGMSTLAGSWIGGGANQAAMKEVFGVEGNVFAFFVTVDILVANVWLMLLLIGVTHRAKIDRFLGVREKHSYEQIKKRLVVENQKRFPLSPRRLLVLLALGLGGTALGHGIGDYLSSWLGARYPSLAQHSLTSSFFWMVITATTVGLVLSLTRARKLESTGASGLGEVFLYFLVATIGMSVDLRSVISHPALFLAGALWISIHGGILLLCARLLRAPFFFVAVGSQANVGGAASAPVVAGAFHPSLAPVGVLLAVAGYALGTYAAYLCGLWMQSLAP